MRREKTFTFRLFDPADQVQGAKGGERSEGGIFI